MKVPGIIFSFVLVSGEVVSGKEHDSLKVASEYVGFAVSETKENETRFYTIMTDNDSDLHTNATWVVNFKSSPSNSDVLSKHRIENEFLENALKMVLRERSISKILDDENI